MDLRRQPPRRPSNTSIAGMVNLARMTDKARGHNRETIGDFVYGEDSGLDLILLEFLDLSANDFADAAGRYDDGQLGAWVLKASGKAEAEIAAFNAHHLARVPEDDAGKQRLKDRLERFAPGNTKITTLFQSLELDDWGNFREVDLTAKPPRSPYCRDVAGLYAAARMADKARADKSRKRNDYIYNCPIDQILLGFLDISAEAFQEAAWQNPNDIELTEWVLAESGRTAAERSRCNAEIARNAPDTDEKRGIFQDALNRVAPGRSDITTWFDLLDLDDVHSYGLVDLSRRPPRSPFDTSVGGIASLARMVDKGRAARSDTLGEYWYGQDSLFDRLVLEFLGLSAEAFLGILAAAPTDAAVLERIRGKNTSTAEEIEAFNNRFLLASPETDDRKAWLTDRVAGSDPDRADIVSFAAMVHLDDRITFSRLRAGI